MFNDAGLEDMKRHLQDLKLQSGEQWDPLGQQCQLSAHTTALASMQQPYPVKDNRSSEHVVRTGHRVTISGQYDVSSWKYELANPTRKKTLNCIA